jgi:Holliday junction DNA helicase RuvA
MIASLRGTLLEKTNTTAVVEVNGVGYRVFLGEISLDALPSLGEEVFFHIVESMAMYGGGVTLYGFLRSEEERLFNVLRENVPGTGAKKALEFLDTAGKSLPDFRRAILEKDVKALVTLFGFTAKTAEKLVAALHGKIDTLGSGRAATLPLDSAFGEALQGLVSLGYREPTARQAAQSARVALGVGALSRDMIREALRHLSRSDS